MEKSKPELIKENIHLFKLNEFLSNKNIVLKALLLCNLPISRIEFIKKYNAGNDRVGAICQFKDLLNGKTKHVIIDMINGKYCSYQQLLDVAFIHGKNCDYRIIMHNGENKGFYPLEYEEVFSEFFTYINDHGLNIFQAEIEPHFLIELSQIELLDEPPIESEYIHSSLPALSEFQTAEFWQFYHYPTSGYYPPVDYKNSMSNLFCINHHYGSSNADLILRWDENGAIYHALTVCENETLRRLLKYDLPEIKGKYDGKEIRIKNLEKGYVELNIVIDPRPINDFYFLDLKEKAALAHFVSEEFFNFCDLMNDYLYPDLY